ncbi:hypothetical protein LR48_Vigan09g164400 [Vigna angularis]|uniref:Fiber protein Fb11 n=1 Tax=Phaseolus angularis TaxID=3914 RepID=A0A0L9VD61_PHAAN|nr:hypothetical protein LR48_Vigan09g164400 [Vigna angularis]
MEKLKMFVVQEPVVAASCLIAGFGLFLPAVVRPMLDSYQATKQPPQPALSDVSVAFDTNTLFSNPSSSINLNNIFVSSLISNNTIHTKIVFGGAIS